MTDVVALVPLPQAPCQECVENARHQTEDVGIVWCHHNRYGGLYLAELGQWQVYGPFGEEADFRRFLFNMLAATLQKTTR